MDCSRAFKTDGASASPPISQSAAAQCTRTHVVRQEVAQARQGGGCGRAYLAEQIRRVVDAEGDAVVEEAQQKRHDLGQVTAHGPQGGDGGGA
ncbi:MAG: hypothetical protein JF597_19170 [Streptomyces sp.]|uniref:hypothetical protein n=1 Tax=Streptomyces sp. TaxID=1931 RepID=UPI0025E6C806|nr:hypothetical protein [Streptomyces sp.]MBW8795630.1 hypothetical protein [Streptomyces sp.]